MYPYREVFSPMYLTFPIRAQVKGPERTKEKPSGKGGEPEGFDPHALLGKTGAVASSIIGIVNMPSYGCNSCAHKINSYPSLGVSP
jgi:hypothetical protein